MQQRNWEVFFEECKAGVVAAWKDVELGVWDREGREDCCGSEGWEVAWDSAYRFSPAALRLGGLACCISDNTIVPGPQPRPAHERFPRPLFLMSHKSL